MNASQTFSNRRLNMNICHSPLRYMVTPLAVFGTCFVLDRALCRAETSDTADEQGVQVPTRGPVHEAFAGVVTFNPEPGVEAPKAPPELIKEVPPDERPEGATVSRIPGYWAWDDERNDFLWVSGVWRALPPGR
jgi:WXXGXW repeat (2 copies)